MLIYVHPVAATLDDTRWGVWMDTGETTLLLGHSKHSCDADFAAECLARGITDIHTTPDDESRAAMAEFMRQDRTKIRVEHYPEQRAQLMSELKYRTTQKRKEGQ